MSTMDEIDDLLPSFSEIQSSNILQLELNAILPRLKRCIQRSANDRNWRLNLFPKNQTFFLESSNLLKQLFDQLKVHTSVHCSFSLSNFGAENILQASNESLSTYQIEEDCDFRHLYFNLALLSLLTQLLRNCCYEDKNVQNFLRKRHVIAVYQENIPTLLSVQKLTKNLQSNSLVCSIIDGFSENSDDKLVQSEAMKLPKAILQLLINFSTDNSSSVAYIGPFVFSHKIFATVLALGNYDLMIMWLHNITITKRRSTLVSLLPEYPTYAENTLVILLFALSANRHLLEAKELSEAATTLNRPERDDSWLRIYCFECFRNTQGGFFINLDTEITALTARLRTYENKRMIESLLRFNAATEEEVNIWLGNSFGYQSFNDVSCGLEEAMDSSNSYDTISYMWDILEDLLELEDQSKYEDSLLKVAAESMKFIFFCFQQVPPYIIYLNDALGFGLSFSEEINFFFEFLTKYSQSVSENTRAVILLFEEAAAPTSSKGSDPAVHTLSSALIESGSPSLEDFPYKLYEAKFKWALLILSKLITISDIIEDDLAYLMMFIIIRFLEKANKRRLELIMNKLDSQHQLLSPFLGSVFSMRDAIHFVGNVISRTKLGQIAVLAFGGLEMLLNHLYVDENEPLLRETSTLALRYATEGSEENQKALQNLISARKS